MSVYDVIKTDPAAVKRYVKDGHTPEMAQAFAAADILEKELGPVIGGKMPSPFREWLAEQGVKHTWSSIPPTVTGEQWLEWLKVRDGYTAALNAKRSAEQAEREAKRQREHAAQIATLHAELARNTIAEAHHAADKARRVRVVAHLQAATVSPVELNPVDWQELHKLKKHPNRAKRQLATRWRECFEALPDEVQTAWLAFYGPTTVTAPPSDDPVDDDADPDADPMRDDDDNDNDTKSANPETITAHVILLPPGERNVDSDNADIVQTGVKHPAFRAFIPFSEGVRRLLDLIGNPIDDVILPPADPFRPQPAQELDKIQEDDDFADIVPGLIPPGLTVPHGDAKHCKSLFLQKIAVVVADTSGATLDGIEVEHGPVIYNTLDPGAEAKRIKPGIIEIRNRLGLKPSGRLHLTDAPLVLNEPASVAYWLDLNKARLPCKLIIVDSLFAAAAGSLAQDDVVRGCMEGVRTLLRHADAVVTPHHDNKQGDIFGSVFLKAMMVSKVAIARNALKDGSLGDQVMVTTEFLKFDSAHLKLKYTLDGPYLDANAPRDMTEGIKRPDILALLPDAPTAVSAARKLIKDKLSGKTPKSCDEEWRRLRHHWAERGVVMVKDGTICRVE